MFVEMAGAAADYSADVAWSPAGSRYGLVYVDSSTAPGATRLMLGLVAPDGTFNPNRIELADDNAREPAITWGEDAFGVTWTQDNASDRGVYFVEVESNGGRDQAVYLALGNVDQPRVGRFASGDWFVAWRDRDAFPVGVHAQVPPPFGPGPSTPRVLSPDVGPRGEPTLLDAAGFEDGLAVFYDTGDLGFGFYLFDDAFDGDGSFLDRPGFAPSITATSDGYAIAYVTATGIAVERYIAASEGFACSNPNVEFGSSNTGGDGVDIVATATGLAVLATREESNEVAFFTFDDDCQVVRGPLTVTSTASAPSLPRLAAGDSGFAATWREESTAGEPRGYLRTFGTALCD
jgi:hypothetical protein